MTDVDKFNGQSFGEEIANSITHGIGLIASIVGLIFLILRALVCGNIYSLVSGIIYGVSLIILYFSSTFYHAISKKKIMAKQIFRAFDHCSIFFLILGSYAPFCLVKLEKKIGWILFGFNIFLSVVGIILNLIDIKKFHRLSLIFYLLMGWSIIFCARQIINLLSFKALLLLLIGGIFYSLGIIFYVMTKPKYMHMIWHFFVLGGSVLHYLCILFYVLPVKV